MEEVHEHYDGQGLKGALWTLAGTSIAGVAQRLVNGGFGAGGVGYGAMGAMQSAALAVDAAKDAEIAMLKAEKSTDAKLVEVYKTLAASDTRIAGEVRDLDKRVAALEVAQPLREQIIEQKLTTVASKATDGFMTLQGEIGRLGMVVGGITKTVVPKDAICPEFMPRYNTWTAPVTTTTGTAATK